MAAVYHHDFSVEGAGRFPVDMLRYDSCWPRHQEDVVAAFPGRGRELERRTVHLTGAGQSGPTIDRWRSFGWIVLIGNTKRKVS